MGVRAGGERGGVAISILRTIPSLNSSQKRTLVIFFISPVIDLSPDKKWFDRSLHVLPSETLAHHEAFAFRDISTVKYWSVTVTLQLNICFLFSGKCNMHWLQLMTKHAWFVDLANLSTRSYFEIIIRWPSWSSFKVFSLYRHIEGANSAKISIVGYSTDRLQPLKTGIRSKPLFWYCTESTLNLKQCLWVLKNTIN